MARRTQRRRRPDDVKSAARGFEQVLDPGKAPKGIQREDISRTRSDPGRYGEIYDAPPPRAAPRAAPKPRPAPARAKPAPSRPSRPKVPPIPPRRPPDPTEPVRPPDPGPTGTPLPPLVMPQYDPGGSVTGQDSPPAPGSSTQGWPVPPPQYNGMPPPMTGPGSDRMGPPIPGQMTGPGGMQPLPQGQSAASIAGGAINDFASPLTGAISNAIGVPPAQVPPAGPAGGAIVPPPMAGPGADRMQPPPPGLLDSLGGWLKKTVPPFGGI